MLFLSSGDASDSICPKGWEMVGYNGDRSYQKLIANVYGMNKTNTILTTNKYLDYQNKIRPDDFILQLTFSFLRAGNCDYASGICSYRKSGGSYWSNMLRSNIATYYLVSDTTFLSPQAGYYKGYGYSLRCVAKVFCFIKHFCYFSLNKPRE